MLISPPGNKSRIVHFVLTDLTIDPRLGAGGREPAEVPGAGDMS
jgi:hypothetical protein